MAAQQLQTAVEQLRRIAGRQGLGGLSEAELLERVVSVRDEAAFEVLVWRHGPMVLGVCRRVLRHAQDAEDAFQATFLTLARKAHSLGRREALAGWLYRVAYRIALRAQASASKHRRLQETTCAAVCQGPAYEPRDMLELAELQAGLNQELERLPARYRSPLIICLLQGKTHAQAARELGWPLGSVSRHLTRARELLRKRLSRRGLVLSAGGLAALVADQSAALSAPLVLQTVAAARSFMAGGAALAGIAPQCVTLANGALRSLFLNKIKSLVLIVLAANFIALTTGVLVRSAWQEEQREQAVPKEESGETQAAGGTDLFGDLLPEDALARLGTVRLRHENGVMALAFHPNGRVIVSGARDCVRLWDAATGKPLGRLQEGLPWQWILSLAFTPDGKTLAVGNSSSITLWDMESNQQLRSWPANGGWVHALAFSSDSKTLASAGNDNIICLWDPATGQARHRLQGHQGLVNCLAFAPDGKTLVSGSDDNTARLWETATGKELRRFGKQTPQPGSAKSQNGRRWSRGEVTSVAIASDGKTVAILTYFGPIRLYEIASGNELRAIHATEGDFGRLAFSPDSKLLAAICTETRMFDVATGQVVRTLPEGKWGHLAFSPDGQTLATWPHDNLFRLWDVRTGKSRLNFDSGQVTVGCLALAPRGNQAASGSLWQKDLLLWDRETGKQTSHIVGKQPTGSFWSKFLGTGSSGPGRSRVDAVAYAPDGKTLAFAGFDTLHLLDTATQTERATVPTSMSSVAVLGFAPDGQTLATAGYDGKMVLWDPATAKEIRRWQAHKGNVMSIAFSHDGKVMASDGVDKILRLWDVATGKELCHCEGGMYVTMSLAFSPDGRWLASATSGESFLRLRDPSTGKELRRIEGQANTVAALAFSPDGRSLAAGGWDGTVRIHELASNQERHRFLGHQGEITALSFARDGQSLASASSDTTILIWDVDGRKQPGKASILKLSSKALDASWADLASDDAEKAYRALRSLIAVPTQTVPFFTKQLHTVPVPSAAETEHVKLLLSDLGNERFEKRRQATAELEAQRESIEPQLRDFLQHKPPLESRQRVEQILRKGEGRTPERLRIVRAVEALEHIGDPAARQLLDKLSQGARHALLTQEAKAASTRLQNREERNK